MSDAFDRMNGVDEGNGDAFDRFPVNEESLGKSSARTVLQIPQGVAEGTKLGLAASLFQFLAAGETDIGVDEFHRLRKLYEDRGEKFNEEGYEEARQQLLQNIPTVSNLGRITEEKTGIPLEPKTRLQKDLRLASLATKALPESPGLTFRGATTGLSRPILGAGIGGASETLHQLGIPEPLNELASFAILKPVAPGAPIFSIGPSKKPSGMTNQRFEKLKKPTEVSESAISKVNDRLESEFRTISDNIIKESPIKDTYENLKNDFGFKQKSSEGFENVNQLAESYQNKYKTSDLTKKLSEEALKKTNKGISPSEFDKKHNEFIKDFIKDAKKGEFTTSDLVSQYRKNNKSLGEAYEPGQSFAHNNAKREALLDYNKTIAEMIEKEHPNTEFSNLFKKTNQKWTEISDAEAINKFLDGLFEGKIQYQKGRQFFDKQGMTVPFKRAMGKEGFAKFETLMSDLMSTEQASKLMRQAKSKGFVSLAKTGVAYLVHPSVAGYKIGFDILKGSYKKAFEYLLDKPQLAITWDKGIKATQAGNFKVAQEEFSKLESAINPRLQEAKKEAVKSFNKNKLNDLNNQLE